MTHSRREFLRDLGVGAAAIPFVLNLPSLGFANQTARKQRLIVMFSPNGVVPKTFWPVEVGAKFAFKESLKPLEPFQKQTLVLRGIGEHVRGDGCAHLRGIGCLLTGIELFPGNLQGGSETPAGWSSGHSLDQELKTFLQKNPATKTRFGSLELGVLVPDRADTFTRMSYSAANKPVTPVSDPYQLFNKLYGKSKDREVLRSILDDVRADLKKVGSAVSVEDKRLLDEHAEFVREMEVDLKADAGAKAPAHPVPEPEAGVKAQNDNMPKLSKMTIDLLVNSFASDFARVATLQFASAVADTTMKWIGVPESHHELSHEPDSNAKAQEKLTKINAWYCEQLAYLAKKLADTPEPGGGGTLLDNTAIVWTNELGQGNIHTLEDIPYVLVGGGLNFKLGQSIKFSKAVPHNRLLLSLAHGFGHTIKTFGNKDYCAAGPLGLT